MTVSPTVLRASSRARAVSSTPPRGVGGGHEFGAQARVLGPRRVDRADGGDEDEPPANPLPRPGTRTDCGGRRSEAGGAVRRFAVARALAPDARPCRTRTPKPSPAVGVRRNRPGTGAYFGPSVHAQEPSPARGERNFPGERAVRAAFRPAPRRPCADRPRGAVRPERGDGSRSAYSRHPPRTHRGTRVALERRRVPSWSSASKRSRPAGSG
jgi:hypothetical protein